RHERITIKNAMIPVNRNGSTPGRTSPPAHVAVRLARGRRFLLLGAVIPALMPLGCHSAREVSARDEAPAQSRSSTAPVASHAGIGNRAPAPVDRKTAPPGNGPRVIYPAPRRELGDVQVEKG